MLGVSRNQIRNRLVHEYFPELHELEELITRALDRKQTFGRSLSLSFPQWDRDDIEVLCRVSPFTTEPEPLALVEILDTTPWRHLDREKALINQHDASRRIIRQLAHEIRNPLGGIRGSAQLLERELPDAGLREFTQVIIKETDRLVALTDNLLGPIDRGILRPVNVHELTERVRMLSAADASPGVTIERDYDPSLPPLTVDADQIIQALLNLMRNALQSVDGKGTVTIRTRALSNFLIGDSLHRLVISIEIEDDGPGIPRDLQDSVFYPLVTNREGGTGLGLPLAQDLINRHGGLIEFDSSPDRTLFFMRIPVEV